tara:strand:- start:341 stop:637 length:297 start_codon:yes stop_codon:yes gene_type:complete
MIVTEKAQQRIDQTLSDTESLRVSVNGGGCSGYLINLKKETNSDGIWITHNVLTDSISEEFLSEATLDWTDDPFQPTFKFNIPDTHSCGCGNSFQRDT